MNQQILDRTQEILLSVLMLSLEDEAEIATANLITKTCNKAISAARQNDMITAQDALAEVETLYHDMMKRLSLSTN